MPREAEADPLPLLLRAGEPGRQREVAVVQVARIEILRLDRGSATERKAEPDAASQVRIGGGVAPIEADSAPGIRDPGRESHPPSNRATGIRNQPVGKHRFCEALGEPTAAA